MRVARPLVPSEGMRRVLRLVSAVRAAAITLGQAAVVVDTTPTGSGTLEVGALAAIEAELGTELHDDVLVVLAARIPMLTTATALQVDQLLDRVDRAHRPDGWVSIAWVSERPFEARHSPGHGGDLYDLYVPVPARAESVVAPGGFFDAPAAFPTWAEEQLRQALANREDWLELRERVAMVTDVPAFALAAGAPVVTAPIRRVLHDKFGPGTVTRELEGGAKLVIAFADAERTLLARFVRDA
jgi:hypothetical protein